MPAWARVTPPELATAHPSEFQDIVDKLEVQFWTNNPYVVDCFDINDVIAAGKTRAMKLSCHPKWYRWSGSMRAGEFWASVGESWVDSLEENKT